MKEKGVSANKGRRCNSTTQKRSQKAPAKVSNATYVYPMYLFIYIQILYTYIRIYIYVRVFIYTILYVFTSSLIFYRLKIAIIVHSVERRRIRSVWCKPTSNERWMAVKNDFFGPEWWKANLRMSRETFDKQCSNLRPYLTKEVTRFRLPVTVEK